MGGWGEIMCCSERCHVWRRDRDLSSELKMLAVHYPPHEGIRDRETKEEGKT